MLCFYIIFDLGFASPDLFISKSATFSEGVATADSDYLFGISDYKVCMYVCVRAY